MARPMPRAAPVTSATFPASGSAIRDRRCGGTWASPGIRGRPRIGPPAVAPGAATGTILPQAGSAPPPGSLRRLAAARPHEALGLDRPVLLELVPDVRREHHVVARTVG